MATQSPDSSPHSGLVGEAGDQAVSTTARAQITRTSGAAGSHHPAPPSPSRTMPRAPAQSPDAPATDHTASDACAFLMRALRWERRLAELRAAHGRARRDAWAGGDHSIGYILFDINNQPLISR